jgi:hypothetical protein
MKKIFFICTIFATVITSCSTLKTSLSNYFVSSNAHSLMDSYRDLITQTNTKECPYDNTGNPAANPKVKGNRYTSFSAMTAKGYNAGTTGYISFSSWYWFEHTEPKSTIPFHTAWFSDSIQANAVLCKSSWPIPIVNPFPSTANIDNHVFEVILVPIAVYQSANLTASLFSHAEDIANPFAAVQIKAADIKVINDVYIEADGEYMSKKIASKYSDVNSSVGIICDVIMKNGQALSCYVFNNYDGSGTMHWKNKK